MWSGIGDLDIDLPEDKFMQAGSKHKDLLKLVPPGDNYLCYQGGLPKPMLKWRSGIPFLLKLSPESDRDNTGNFSNNRAIHWKNRF